VRVLFAPEALEAIRYKRVWWEANRDKARDELEEVIAKLRAGATEGAQLYTVHARTRSGAIWGEARASPRGFPSVTARTARTAWGAATEAADAMKRSRTARCHARTGKT
jgi:hypothetical protein